MVSCSCTQFFSGELQYESEWSLELNPEWSLELNPMRSLELNAHTMHRMWYSSSESCIVCGTAAVNHASCVVQQQSKDVWLES